MKTRSQAEKGKKVDTTRWTKPLIKAEVSLNEWYKTRRLQSWEYLIDRRCARPAFKTLGNYTSCVRKLHYDSGSRFDVICLDQMPSFKLYIRTSAD